MLGFAEQMGLKNWPSLNAFLKTKGITEGQVQDMLNYELKNKRRETFVIRIHSKLCKLIAIRERKEYVEICRRKDEDDYYTNSTQDEEWVQDETD